MRPRYSKTHELQFKATNSNVSLQSFIRGCLAYRKEDRMDVFALARHEYLQPPLPKHGRQTAQQQQAAQQQSTIGNQSSGGGGGGGVSVGQSAASAAAAFSTGLFGNMNQSSSS